MLAFFRCCCCVRRPFEEDSVPLLLTGLLVDNLVLQLLSLEAVDVEPATAGSCLDLLPPLLLLLRLLCGCALFELLLVWMLLLVDLCSLFFFLFFLSLNRLLGEASSCKTCSFTSSPPPPSNCVFDVLSRLPRILLMLPLLICKKFRTSSSTFRRNPPPPPHRLPWLAKPAPLSPASPQNAVSRGRRWPDEGAFAAADGESAAAAADCHILRYALVRDVGSSGWKTKPFLR